MSTGQKKEQINLQDDDEFAEFEIQDWTDAQEDTVDVSLWIDNWDNDDLQDDFSKQLRAELQKIQSNN
ncbi:DSS1/SEM1 family-domain-containing protein [Globomyces pollinis-pini]|nr:DSS1/SEM1 family-domain-containing protein [Globomyces pollinis-pini]